MCVKVTWTDVNGNGILTFLETLFFTTISTAVSRGEPEIRVSVVRSNESLV